MDAGAGTLKTNSAIRRAMLVTLMVFATAGVGLQPLVFALGSGCTCDAMASVDRFASADNSCGTGFAEEQASCCSSQPIAAKQCCCDPQALACECGGCGCIEDEDSRTSLPLMPPSEKTEVVTPTLICDAPLVGYPRVSKIKRVEYFKSVAEFSALSSQQTCILLSRFTC